MSRNKKMGIKESKPSKISRVSYQEFFQEALALGKVKPWQNFEIIAFFKDLGLTEKEPSDVYLEALGKY